MVHKKKWQLLSNWYKTIILLYAFLSPIAFITICLSFFTKNIPLSLYGISSSSQFSSTGLFILSLILVKAVVGCSFIIGHNKAPIIGLIDSAVGIICCLFIGFIFPFFNQKESIDIVFRVELLILIPFLLKSFKIRKSWNGPYLSAGINK